MGRTFERYELTETGGTILSFLTEEMLVQYLNSLVGKDPNAVYVVEKVISTRSYHRVFGPNQEPLPAPPDPPIKMHPKPHSHVNYDPSG